MVKKEELSVQQQLRAMTGILRTKPVRLMDLMPLMQRAADVLDNKDKQIAELQAAIDDLQSARG
jgi:hypothetical protein